MNLTIDVAQRGASTVITLAGDIDLHTAPRLREVLSERARKPDVIVVDLTAVKFLDSSGVGAFVGAAPLILEAGGAFRLACPPPRVQKVFRISRLAEVIPIYDDVAAAITG